MDLPFGKQHAVLLLKYSGISFISGAVNHGFFSGERSLWTAGAGVLLFVLGLWLERGDRPSGQLGSTLLWGTLLSVGLGFFTGGLQHFPDSPSRSAWVVPLGFALSLAALAVQQPGGRTRMTAAYVAVAGTLVVAGSVAGWHWLGGSAGPQLVHDHGAGADRPVAQVVSRTIEVSMSDAMRFLPEAIQVRAGETVRIVTRNQGQVPHELVIGTPDQLQAHATQMREQAGHAHQGAVAVTVSPGQVGELVVTFPAPAPLEIACLVPGHYEAGMRGRFDVVAQLDAPAASPSGGDAKPRPSSPHGHDGHSHGR